VKPTGKPRTNMGTNMGTNINSDMDIKIASEVGDAPTHGWLRVISAAHAMLEQCEGFVKDVPASVYGAESQVLPGGTVGKHLRHMLDHYAAILEPAVLSGSIDVDYDHRDRDTPMESDREAAMHRLGSLRDQVARLPHVSEATTVRVRIMITSDGGEATLGSTLARELAFATHHAVHHQAMMKAIAGEFGVEAAPDFGKAPSTINHLLVRK